MYIGCYFDVKTMNSPLNKSENTKCNVLLTPLKKKRQLCDIENLPTPPHHVNDDDDDSKYEISEVIKMIPPRKTKKITFTENDEIFVDPTHGLNLEFSFALENDMDDITQELNNLGRK